jgi:hypothetical protein
MVKPKLRADIDLGPDEYRGANALAPKRDRELPGAIMVAGLAIFVTVVLSPVIPTEHGVRFMILTAALAAAAFGWGLGGLLRPYRLVPKPEKIRIVPMEFDNRGGAHEVTPLGSTWAGLLLSIAVVVAIEWYRHTFWQDLLFPTSTLFSALAGFTFAELMYRYRLH